MINTFETFNDRKEEILFYFSVVKNIDEHPENKKITSESTKLVKIMKSNLLLMLYNLIEACIVSGLLEIYENLKSENCSYDSVIEEIQKLWRNSQVISLYNQPSMKPNYEKKVKKIIEHITSHKPIELYKSSLDISGNLDASKIKKLCDDHRIRYSLVSRGESLEMVKRERNNLAHGDVSFSDCAKDITLTELNNIIQEVFSFMKSILDGMKKYYDSKEFLSDR